MKLTLYIAGALHIAFGIFFLLASSGAPASEGGLYLGPALGGTIGGFVMLALGRAIQLLKRIERSVRRPVEDSIQP
ncbi:hypothetical protein [Methylobacterium sp. Leaf88]|uniref:hypothetical protein n=1 Tax=Methylobacterium sp. Leaf88 TaxID=1736244 RepID=UPI0006FFAAEB|nr:hypothetical protein [Methylobacterium sp. Leaf88]KQO76442.1 hypothetical protein ASF20_13940 [Methylobacterium sp. Leaf88]